MTYIIFLVNLNTSYTHICNPDSVLWNQVQDNAECQFTVPNLKSVSHQPVFEVSAVDPHNFPGWEILQARWYWKQRVTVIKWQKVGANPTANIDEGPTEIWTWAMQSCQPKSISKGLPVAVLSHALAINDWCLTLTTSTTCGHANPWNFVLTFHGRKRPAKHVICCL